MWGCGVTLSEFENASIALDKLLGVGLLIFNGVALLDFLDPCREI